MDVNFTVRLGAVNGSGGPGGMEGVVFHIQNDNIESFGQPRGGLAYDGAYARAFAVELDCLRSATYDDSKAVGHTGSWVMLCVRVRACGSVRPCPCACVCKCRVVGGSGLERPWVYVALMCVCLVLVWGGGGGGGGMRMYAGLQPLEATWHYSAHTEGAEKNTANEALSSQSAWQRTGIENFCDQTTYVRGST
jgi:hypothetical protein